MNNVIKIIIGFFAVLAVTAQTAWAEENPFTSRAFWAEMKQTENWQEIVQSHIDQGWDITEIDPKYGTALHNTVLEGFSASVPVLIDYGVDVNALDGFKSTPLHYAATLAKEEDSDDLKASSLEVVKLLVQKNANLNAVNLRGDTPLHDAFGYGTIDTINYLIEAGADQTIINKSTNTPFENIQVGRGRPVLGSLFYFFNKNKFTEELRVVWASWDKGKRILKEDRDGTIVTLKAED